MSAYICNPEHFGVLAAWAVTHDCVIYSWQLDHQSGSIINAQNVARLLARENIRSVAHRYPNDKDGERPGPGLKDAEIEEAAAIYAAHFIANPPPLSVLEVLNLCAGYSYQASEVDDWRTTDAELQIEWVQSAAIRRLRGYDEVDWSYDNQVPAIEALYAKGDQP